MSGQYAEITLGAGNVDLIDLAGEGEFFRRDQIEMEGRHGVPCEWRMANSEWRRRKRGLGIRYSLFAIRPLGCFGGQLLALFDRLIDVADHVEGGFRQVIVLAFTDGTEALDGVGQFDELAGRSCEDFGDEEWLRQEALDLARPGDGDLVLFGQFVHAENGDDVLQRLVLLQHLLNHAGGLVMLFADNERRQHARGRVERIDRRVDALFGTRAVQPR